MRKCCAIVLLGLVTACCPLPGSWCATQKITFTQATGCRNDGSFEFCIPADDENALDAVLEIAPTARCMSSMGRARCDLKTQVLCMVETRGMCEPEPYAAMTDAGWQTVCDLANLPFIQEIVPTWYE